MTTAKRLCEERMKKRVRYPLAVEELCEAGSDGGDFLGYWSRGHHDPEEFAAAARKLLNEEPPPYYPFKVPQIETLDVHHVWWRTVPIAGDPGMYQWVPAEAGSRGAFPATVWCVAEVRLRIKQSQTDNIDAAPAPEFPAPIRAPMGDATSAPAPVGAAARGTP